MTAIAVAAAAPAFAASAANMSTSSGTFRESGNFILNSQSAGAITVIFRNSGSGPTVGLAFVVTLSSGVFQNSAQHNAAGFTPTVLSATQVQFTAINQMAAGSTLDVTFSVRKVNGSAAGTASAVIQVDPPGIGGALTSFTYAGG